MRPVTILSLVLFVFLAAACGGKVDPNTPPEIVYGEDICDQCGMIISDERFAAAAVVEVAENDYEQRLFDDIGGMFRYAAEHPELNFATFFVHDYNSKEWIDAREAHFVLADELHTPMGYGVAACSRQAEATALAEAWSGKVVSFMEAQMALGAMPEGEHGHTEGN